MAKYRSLEEVKVRVIYPEKLEKLFGIEVPENQKLSIVQECVYEDLFMIKKDCNFSSICNYYHKGVIQKCLLFECSFDTRTENGWQMGTVQFGKFMTFSDFLENSFLISITEFISYNYNPRIRENQKLLLQYINDFAS